MLYLKPNNIQVDTILFDFDGTLAHLTLDFQKMRNLVIAELSNILGDTHPALASMTALPVMELIYEASRGQKQSITHEIYRRCEAVISSYEVEAAKHSRLFCGIEKLLKNLKDANIATGIVTRNCKAAVETVFPQHGALCGALVSRNDVKAEHLKPKPGQLLTALEILGRKAEHTLMVGDHPIDIKSGKNAGCFTAGVLCGNASRTDLENAQADLISENCITLFKNIML